MTWREQFSEVWRLTWRTIRGRNPEMTASELAARSWGKLVRWCAWVLAGYVVVFLVAWAVHSW